jgi:hypothetical protein
VRPGIAWFVTFCNDCELPRNGGISGSLIGPSFGSSFCDTGLGGSKTDF